MSSDETLRSALVGSLGQEFPELQSFQKEDAAPQTHLSPQTVFSGPTAAPSPSGHHDRATPAGKGMVSLAGSAGLVEAVGGELNSSAGVGGSPALLS